MTGSTGRTTAGLREDSECLTRLCISQRGEIRDDVSEFDKAAAEDVSLSRLPDFCDTEHSRRHVPRVHTGTAAGGF